MCPHCSTVEVLFYREDQSLVLWNALDFVAPFPCNLDSRLDGLGAGVHRQDHLEAQRLGDDLSEAREDIVVECA